jgi:hypothetical protein
LWYSSHQVTNVFVHATCNLATGGWSIFVRPKYKISQAASFEMVLTG